MSDEGKEIEMWRGRHDRNVHHTAREREREFTLSLLFSLFYFLLFYFFINIFLFKMIS